MATKVNYVFWLANVSNLFYSGTVYLVQMLHEMKNKNTTLPEHVKDFSYMTLSAIYVLFVKNNFKMTTSTGQKFT